MAEATGTEDSELQKSQSKIIDKIDKAGWTGALLTSL
jgi:hypothetical protein